MNNYYTLIQVTHELRQLLDDACFTEAVSFRKNRLELYFHPPESSDPVQITFSCHPKRVSIFRSTYFPPKKKDIVSFFEQLKGNLIKKIHLVENDRLLDFKFNGNLHLRFQLFGHGANCYLFDQHDKIVSSFRGERKLINHNIPEAREPVIAGIDELDGNTESMMIQRDPKLPRRWIADLCRQNNLYDSSKSDIAAFTDNLSEVLTDYPVADLVYDSELCIIPEEWLPIEREHIGNFNEAVRIAFAAQTRNERLQQGKKKLLSLLEAEQKRLKSRIKEADNAIKALERAESYEQFGNILMSMPEPQSIVDDQQLEAPDLYGQNETIKIPVKPGVSIIDNANRFYKKAKDARKSAEMTEGMGEKARKDLGRLEALYSELSEIQTLDSLQEFENRYASELEKLVRSSSSGTKSKPFKISQIAGYEIWIGKNAKSNDALLRSAHKEDLWLHSRDGAGSHVLVRMAGRKEFPDHQIIEKAASVAAQHSKAGSSSVVPVRYAKRKHLRKAKGAPPGEVKVDHEKVILVEPKPVEQVAD